MIACILSKREENTMKTMVNAISAMGTIASILGLAFIKEMPHGMKYFFIIAGILGLAILLYDIYIEKKNMQINEMICTSDDQIKEEMQNLINMQGKICIMSRDLTWVDEKIKKCIIEKKSSILIFAEKETDLTKALEKNDVDIRYYGKTGFIPNTRFTVVRYNKSDRQVAIANTKNTLREKNRMEHTIYMTSGDPNDKRDSWLSSLAYDMISLCEKISEGGNGKKNL